MNAIEVRDSIHEINAREKNIEELEKRTRSVASDWLREAVLQGQDLNKLKSGVKVDWQPLFDTGRLSLIPGKATIYMRIASTCSRGQLQDDGRQQLLTLFSYDEEQQHTHEDKQPKQWPGYIEAIARASRFVGFVERVPLKQWPAEGVKRLKEQILPIASELWPERFA